MEPERDFLHWLQTDMSVKILTCLTDPGDLVRASSVSRFWQHFVIANALSKQLSVRMYPQLCNVAKIVELECDTVKSADAGCSNSMEWKTLERDNKVYGSLLHALKTLQSSPCNSVASAISASSTDHYPDESIVNTLSPRDTFLDRASYWSSKGQSDPEVPETLIYRLKADFCVVTEICIKPFEAYFQTGNPIYAAKSVRFRMGHPKTYTETESDTWRLAVQQPMDDKFIWTYTSQEFPMTQENRLQQFKLPEPVLCIGGFLQIELLGRVQRQEIDGLFYICVAHVQVLGSALSPAFAVEILEPSGKFLLKYDREAVTRLLQGSSNGEENEMEMPPSPTGEMFWGHVGLLEYLMEGMQAGDDPLDWDEENDLDEVVLL